MGGGVGINPPPGLKKNIKMSWECHHVNKIKDFVSFNESQKY